MAIGSLDAVITVARISIAPVKSLGLSHPEEVRLESTGVARDRRFLLLSPEHRLFDSRRHGRVMTVTAECNDDGTWLRMRFPDGRVLEDEVLAVGEPYEVDLYGKVIRVHPIEGPWSAALADHIGTEVIVARTARHGDGNDGYPVSLVSNASVEELSRQGGSEQRVDPGRFRMLLELDGCRPHEEDEWLGRRVRVGEAMIRVAEHDARCVITTMNPLTGDVDFPTLKTIAAYRGAAGGALNFGMYADVIEPGAIRVGGGVEPITNLPGS
jgi:MOSC domain-containing protein